jgi:hypothetical protein
MRKQRKYVAYKAQVQLHIVYEYKEKRVPFTGYARTVAYVARARTVTVTESSRASTVAYVVQVQLRTSKYCCAHEQVQLWRYSRVHEQVLV